MTRSHKLAGGIIALVAVVGLLAMLRADGAQYPAWMAVVWPVVLVLALTSGVVLLGSGLGLFSTELMAQVGEGRPPTASQWLAVYLGCLGAMVLASFLLQAVARVEPRRSMLVIGGVLFLLAAIGRPWWLLQTFRRTGWFALIKSDTAVQLLFAVAGILLAALGVFMP